MESGNGARAAAIYKESLALAAEIELPQVDSRCVPGGTGRGCADTRTTGSRGATVGSCGALREAIGLSMTDLARAGYEERIAAVRSHVDETIWEKTWAEGRVMMPEEAVEYALQPPATPEEAEEAPPAYPVGLSAREVEVLRLVTKGMTDPQIAEELYISPRTVNAHLRSVYHKIGSSTRAEATRFALEHDLL